MDMCFACDSTGIFLQPNNKELYEKIFDKYDDMGVFTMHEARMKALKETGYTKISPCPCCHKSPEDYKKEK